MRAAIVSKGPKGTSSKHTDVVTVMSGTCCLSAFPVACKSPDNLTSLLDNAQLFFIWCHINNTSSLVVHLQAACVLITVQVKNGTRCNT